MSKQRNHTQRSFQKSLRFFLLSYSVFFLFLFLCIAIRPEGLVANDGVSYFVSFAETAIPYFFAYLLGSILYFLAGYALRNIPSPSARVPSWAFRIFAFLLVGLAVSPHDKLIRTHIAFGSTLFSLQLVLSLWAVSRMKKSLSSVACVLVELAAGIFCAYSLPREDGYLLEAQVVYQTAFLALMFILLKRSSTVPEKVER